MSRSLYYTVYHPNVPKGCTSHRFAVGPFSVHVSNKGHYRLYTCDLDKVVFLKQASCPSIEQLHDALLKAVNERRISKAAALPFLEACAPLLNKPDYGKGIVVKKIPDPAELAAEKRSR